MGYVDTNFQVAMQALFLLALAVLFTGIVAEFSGRMVRVLPVALLAALPVGLSPRRRRLMSAAYLVAGLGPQLWLAAMIVAPPDGLRDNARALLAMELAVVAVWLAYLVRLPRASTARWADWRLPASEAPPAEGDRAREFAPRVGWAVWVAVGAALLAVVVWAWPQLSGDPEVAGRGLVPAFLTGLTLVYTGGQAARQAAGTPPGLTRPRLGVAEAPPATGESQEGETWHSSRNAHANVIRLDANQRLMWCPWNRGHRVGCRSRSPS